MLKKAVQYFNIWVYIWVCWLQMPKIKGKAWDISDSSRYWEADEIKENYNCWRKLGYWHVSLAFHVLLICLTMTEHDHIWIIFTIMTEHVLLICITMTEHDHIWIIFITAWLCDIIWMLIFLNYLTTPQLKVKPA